MLKKSVLTFLASTAILALPACSDENGSAITVVDSAEAELSVWGAFTQDYLDGYFPLNPVFAVGQGKHEYDGQLPDWSEEGLKASLGYLKQARNKAAAFSDDDLGEAERFERDYLVAAIDGEIFWAETADWPHVNPAMYIGGLSPATYVTVPYADTATRFAAYVQYLENVPAAASHIRVNLKTPMPATYVDLGIAAFQGFADYYRGDARKEFDTMTDPQMLARHDKAMAAASDSMEELAEWLRGQRATATDDYALGADKFAAMLKATEGVDVPLARLKAIGVADMQRNQAALRAACADYAPGQDIRACIKKANDDKPDGGAVQGARNQLASLKQFVADNDIVTIPSDQEANVEESPPYNRSNLAYINIPGPYETGLPSVYYISPPDPSWDEAKRRAYIPGKSDLLFISVHEVWPGHFLNFLHANRSDSILGRLFIGYAFAEGWAHYTEEMMWQAGLGDKDPGVHIGQLTNALLRNVRYLSAIGLHTEGMTVAQSRDMFIADGFQSEGSAEQQAARGTYDPAYLNYTMGKLMIQKLREDWTGGDRSKWKAFHDAFLSYGGPPIPMVRAAMMNEDSPKAVF